MQNLNSKYGTGPMKNSKAEHSGRVFIPPMVRNAVDAKIKEDIEKAKEILKNRREKERLRKEHEEREKKRYQQLRKLYAPKSSNNMKSTDSLLSQVKSKMSGPLISKYFDSKFSDEPAIVSKWPDNWRIKGYPPGTEDQSNKSDEGDKSPPREEVYK